MCKSKKNSWLSVDFQGIKLNYLTLAISDPIVNKEFVNHKTSVQNRKTFFWAIQAVVLLNLIVQSLNYLLDKSNALGMVQSIAIFPVMCILWPILIRCRPEWAKYTFPLLFIVEVTLIFFNSVEDSFLYTIAKANENFY